MNNEVKKEHLFGMDMEELRDVVKTIGMPSYSAKQLSEWLYKKHVLSIDDMSNISLKNRELLSERYDVGFEGFAKKAVSQDGTVKYLFPVKDQLFVESVIIPDKERMTICVSTQVGCKMNCLFCMTGKQKFAGNLTANEILNQLYSSDEFDNLTNVVFMGMGEPLDNYLELKKAITIITSDYGMGWSPKRVTVSTIGVLPELKSLLDETSVQVAISLHSPYATERASLMPVQKAFPVESIIDLLKQYDWSHQRRLSFEYIMFDNLNDSFAHAKELSRLLSGLECRVNLLGFHQIPGVSLKPCPKDKMIVFRDTLNKNGLISTVRTSRGEDIDAACGMLSTAVNKKK